MPRDTGETLRAALTELGVPSNLDKRVRSYRSSLSAMMGEEAPRQLLDFDNYLLSRLETLQGHAPETVADRINEAIRDWSESTREDLYGLSPEELRDALIKLEDLSFRDGVRVALEDPKVVSSMFVLLKSGNIDYRKGAIFTLEEAVKRDPSCLDIGLFRRIAQGPFSKEERIMLIENATEFGRMVGRMMLHDTTREQGEALVRDLAESGEDTQMRIALKTFTHLSKVEPDHVDVHLVARGLDSDNDFNRETAARVIQNLAKHVPGSVPESVIERMADDRTWAVRQVAANALVNLWRDDAKRADGILQRFLRSGDENRVKVAEKALQQIEKRRK
jgi:hypothetical protein